jgi:hypothetical protein
MTNYVTKYNINNIFQCPYCLEEKNIGSIRNNKFVINPKFWNFQILTCGHVICNDCYCKHADKINTCATCREKTNVYQVNFNQTSYHEYDKSWKTLAEWFCEFNMELIRIKISEWNSDNNSWTGYYARIRDYSLNIVRKEHQKMKQKKLKLKKEKDKYNLKLKKELDRILPKKKIFGKGEMEKYIKRAEAKIESNKGSYVCNKCQKRIPSKHKVNHQKNCK